MKSKHKLIAGVVAGLAILGVGTAYSLSQSPKATFLLRTKAVQDLKQASQDITFSVQSKNSIISQSIDGFGFKIQGNVKDEHTDVTISTIGENPWLDINNWHIISKGDDIFMSANTLADYYSQTYGVPLDVNLDNQYINLDDFSQEDALPQTDYQIDPELQKEAQEALAQYLIKLPDKHFKKVGDDVIMTLHKEQLKEIMDLLVDTLAKSQHYRVDPKDIKETKKTLQDGFNNFTAGGKLDVIVTQGKTTGNSKISVAYQSDTWGDITLDVKAEVKPYQAPKEPGKIISGDELTHIVQEATLKHLTELGGDPELEQP